MPIYDCGDPDCASCKCAFRKVLPQILHDPENQPSQFGTIPLKTFMVVKEVAEEAVGLLEGIAKDISACAWLTDEWGAAPLTRMRDELARVEIREI